MTPRLNRFLDSTRLTTPVLVVDLERVENNYRALSQAFPRARVFYAMKANPAREVLERLLALGCRLDVASIQEVRAALAAGAGPGALSFGNPIKRVADIAEAWARGVRVYAVDSVDEVEKIAGAAPGAEVVCRIRVENTGAEWPLSSKFGCDPSEVDAVLLRAAALGLEPVGISFHVGSQQTDPEQWGPAIVAAGRVFRRLGAAGVRLRLLNLGGGFPTAYRRPIPGLDAYSRVICQSLRGAFGDDLPDLIIEPGRSLVGDAGVIETEVLLVAARGEDRRRWVYLDVGKFGGLAETLGEAIQYPIVSARTGPRGAVVLAGPTCDSMDVLYETTHYELPLDLRIGDRLRIGATGAYTQSYSSVCFNGFEPLRTLFV
ncbi:MAG: type III PLP-dependent enzyme [Gemmatimonadota bacterium]